MQHFIHTAAVLSWASSRIRTLLWEDAPVESDHTVTITIFPLSRSIYENLDAETPHTSWHWSIFVRVREKKKRLTLQAFEQTPDLIPWSIFVIPRHYWGALGDEDVCCGFMETGLILRLNDLSWLWGLISSPRFIFFSFLQSRPGWSRRASRLYLYFYFSPFTGYESSSYYCKLKHNQYSEYVQDVSLICEIA